MFHSPEPMVPRTRWLYDVGKLALLALILVPIYLLLNQFWQSVLRMLVMYGLLALFCLRLGEYLRRAMRRLPAEIPPWHGAATMTPVNPWMEQRFGAAEAIRSAYHDPQYLQMVLKPRLRRLLVYRLSGTPEVPLEALDDMQLAQVNPALLAFLRGREPLGLWARFRYRQQRVEDVLAALRRLEGI